MQPAVIEGHNIAATAPDGHEEVRTLFVRREIVEGVSMLKSAWEADPREVAFLLAGAKLYLGLSVPVQPVVNLSVADLPADFDPVFTARRFEDGVRGPVCRVEALIADPPHGLRLWAERAIVAGFSAAFQSAVEGIEETARKYGVRL